MKPEDYLKEYISPGVRKDLESVGEKPARAPALPDESFYGSREREQPFDSCVIENLERKELRELLYAFGIDNPREMTIVELKGWLRSKEEWLLYLEQELARQEQLLFECRGELERLYSSKAYRMYVTARKPLHTARRMASFTKKSKDKEPGGG